MHDKLYFIFPTSKKCHDPQVNGGFMSLHQEEKTWKVKHTSSNLNEHIHQVNYITQIVHYEPEDQIVLLQFPEHCSGNDDDQIIHDSSRNHTEPAIVEVGGRIYGPSF